jgi:hypothetical protein
MNEAPRSSVFLHTGWRSVGTWAWSRFRTLPNVAAFYEPLHPMLSELTLADISALTPDWTSGHPALATPYFAEFRPFIREGARGVTGYRKGFGVDRFAPSADADFVGLQRYVQSLCDDSLAREKTPVFKFCRSSGRLPWFKSAFPGALHAVVLRNPASQFASGWMLHQQWNNAFFVAAPFRLLGLNQADPLVRRVVKLFDVQLPSLAMMSPDDYALACERYVRTVAGDNAYRAFVAVWTLAALRATHADLAIDIDRLGQSPDYAALVNAQVGALSGLSPGFGGARDLVAETRRASTRMKQIDGRVVAPVHSTALTFLACESDSFGQRSDMVDTIKAKLMLARELSEPWRY